MYIPFQTCILEMFIFITLCNIFTLTKDIHQHDLFRFVISFWLIYSIRENNSHNVIQQTYREYNFAMC